jgi:hypothetical protein
MRFICVATVNVGSRCASCVAVNEATRFRSLLSILVDLQKQAFQVFGLFETDGVIGRMSGSFAVTYASACGLYRFAHDVFKL